jgi:hypothetical protein
MKWKRASRVLCDNNVTLKPKVKGLDEMEESLEGCTKGLD